jgi:eukaryotic-like serine/threonine-protein kinase
VGEEAAAQGNSGVLLDGRYRLVERLGHTAMEDAWRGRDAVLDRPVAVKTLSVRSVVDDADRARFLEEARIVAGLSHPGIAVIHDYGESDPLPGNADRVLYLVTEPVEGQSVAQMLADGALGTARTCEIVTAAARALDVAHRSGVVHRHLKPANLMMTTRGQVKVTDFAIPRQLGNDPLTSAGLFAGTPDYLAPEVCQGAPATPRSDIYALGVIAYECLTGKRPFHGTSNLATLTAQVRNAPPPLPPEIPRQVAAAVMTALKKDPRRRFLSAAAFADALQPGTGQPGTGGVDRAASVVPSHAGAAPARPSTRTLRPSSTPASRVATPRQGSARSAAGDAAGRRRGVPAAAAALVICAVAGLGTAAAHALLDMTGPSSAQLRTAPAQPQTAAAQVAISTGLPVPRPSASPSARGSLGPVVRPDLAPVVMPDLTLITVARARARAGGAGLTVARTVGVDVPDVGQGRVVRTDPPAGAKIAHGTRVTLYVADGLVTVPDLTGHQLADATDILQNQLRMQVSVTYVVSTADPGVVVGQDLHGSGVVPGSLVRLQVAMLG